MCWLQAYANFVTHKSSCNYAYNKKESRFHGMSVCHSSNYLVIRLPTTHSVNNLSVQSHATSILYNSERSLVNNIGRILLPAKRDDL